MRKRAIVVCGLAVLLGPAVSGAGLQGSTDQPLSTLQRAELTLAEAQSLAEQASDPEVAASAAVRLVAEAMRTAEVAMQLTHQVGGTADALMAAQAVRGRARDVLDGLRLINETRFATRVHSELADLRDRIAGLRPACGVPGFSADWQSNLAIVARRLQDLARGDVDLDSAKEIISRHLEALQLSVEAHESLAKSLCALLDTFTNGIDNEVRKVIEGPRLDFAVRRFETQQQRSRAVPEEWCAPSGYLAVVPGWDKQPGVYRYHQNSPALGAGFFRESVEFDADGAVHLMIPDTEQRTIRTAESHETCGQRVKQWGVRAPVTVTTTLDIAPGGRFAVAVQHVRAAGRSTGYGEHLDGSNPVNEYLRGVLEEVRDLATARVDAVLSESDFVAEYSVRFSRLNEIGRRLAGDVIVMRMLAGDIQGDDRDRYWALYGQHAHAYDESEKAAAMTAAQLQLARETNAARLEEARDMAAASIEAARIQADGIVRAAREQARASRFGAVLGGLSGLLGRFIPTTLLHGVAG